MKVTKALLRRKGACDGQLDKFVKLFPEGVDVVTEALCIEHSSAFEWAWAAEQLLSPAAWAEYKRVRALALAEYDRVTTTAWAEYNRVRAAAWAEYDCVAAAARAEYRRVKAATFGRLAEKE